MAQSVRSASFFDRWSVTYDRPSFQRTTYEPLHDAVLAQLSTAEPDVIVDLGCGTGQLTRRLSATFLDASVIGLDYSDGMLDAARVQLTDSRAAIVRADAQHVPLASASVDIVTCSESFHWYPNQRQALQDIARVLRPGGRLIIVSIATVTGFGADVVRNISSLGGQPVRALPPRRLRHLVERAGFVVDHQRRVPRAGLVPWPVLTNARLR